jgi:hypothetical protein
VGQSRSELLDLLTLWIASITHATVSVGIRARIQPSNICFALKGLGVIISYDCLTDARSVAGCSQANCNPIGTYENAFLADFRSVSGTKMKHRESRDGAKLKTWEGLTELVHLAVFQWLCFLVFFADQIAVLSDRIVSSRSRPVPCRNLRACHP